MSPSCCGMRGVRRIRVGNFDVGLTGLDSALAALYTEGWLPEDEDLGKSLVQQLREAGNYIPASDESLYASVLVELFREFYQASAGSSAEAKAGRKGPRPRGPRA